MDEFDAAVESKVLQRLRLFLYLIPIFGFFPAAWTLSRRQGDRRERAISRLSISLTLVWALGYVLLNSGVASVTETSSQGPLFTLLLLNSLLTSSYFVVNLWLMLRLWQGKSLKLPGISQIAKRLP